MLCIFIFNFNFVTGRFYPRWKEYEAWQAKQLEFCLDEYQWAEDWAALVSQAERPGSSLAQLHVFALAHVLRRPIIVYAVKYVKNYRGDRLGYTNFEGNFIKIKFISVQNYIELYNISVDKCYLNNNIGLVRLG